MLLVAMVLLFRLIGSTFDSLFLTSIRAIAQKFSIGKITIWNILKNKETIDLMSSRHRTGRPRASTAVDDKRFEVYKTHTDGQYLVSLNLLRLYR